MTEKEIREIHMHSARNRQEIERSSQCGCFSCGRIFDASEVEDYIDNEETALCPYCDIDAVVGDASGVVLSQELLKEMKKKYF